MLSLRKVALKQRMSNFEMKLEQISQRKMDLQSYANNIADGVITYNEAATCPSSLFGTQMDYMVNSSGIAYQSAQMKTDAYISQMQSLQSQTGGQYNYAQNSIDATYANSEQAYLLFNEIYKQELEEYAKEVTAQLNEEEKALDAEQARLEAQLQAAEAEYQSVSERMNKNIQADAIKFA